MSLGNSTNHEEESEDDEDGELYYGKAETYVEQCLYQVLSKLIYVQRLELIFRKQQAIVFDQDQQFKYLKEIVINLIGKSHEVFESIIEFGADLICSLENLESYTLRLIQLKDPRHEEQKSWLHSSIHDCININHTSDFSMLKKLRYIRIEQGAFDGEDKLIDQIRIWLKLACAEACEVSLVFRNCCMSNDTIVEYYNQNKFKKLSIEVRILQLKIGEASLMSQCCLWSQSERDESLDLRIGDYFYKLTKRRRCLLLEICQSIDNSAIIEIEFDVI